MTPLPQHSRTGAWGVRAVVLADHALPTPVVLRLGGTTSPSRQALPRQRSVTGLSLVRLRHSCRRPRTRTWLPEGHGVTVRFHTWWMTPLERACAGSACPDRLPGPSPPLTALDSNQEPSE
jgi:hypothetical protein